MKKFSKSVFVFVAFALILGVILTGITGCKKTELGNPEREIPEWKIEAKQAYKNARFAPDLEEIVPGSLLGSSGSVKGISLSRAALTSDSENSISISETGPAPKLGYITLEDEINMCKSRIDYATNLKSQVLTGIDELNVIGEWQDGTRLDIALNGAIEYRERDILSGEVIISVRLSADRTTVEIIDFQKTIHSPNDIHYLYNQYSSYDGEAFLHMDSYEFLRKGSSTDFDSKYINYSEYKKAQNGIMNSSLVQIGQHIEYDDDGLPTGNTDIKQIDITAYGGNDDSFYRYWRQTSEDNSIVEDFYIANAEGNIDVQFFNIGLIPPSYNILASANLFNIERLYLEKEPFSEIKGTVNIKLYKCVGAELSDGTVCLSEEAHWRGEILHYVYQNVFTATIWFMAIPAETGMDDAIAEYGFEFIDAGLDFSSIYNGDALKVLDGIRVSRIEGIKDVEIKFENALTLYTAMYEFFSEKVA